MKGVRWIVAGLVLVGGLVALGWLQGRFDRVDLKRGMQAVLLREPEAKECRAEILSRFRGTVRVDCEGGAWRVDVVKGLLSPIEGGARGGR